MRNSLFLPLLFVVLALSACKDAPPPSSPDPADTVQPGRLLPLALGNTWVYDYTWKDSATRSVDLTINRKRMRPAIDPVSMRYQGTMEFFGVDASRVGNNIFGWLLYAYRNDTLHGGYPNKPFDTDDTVRLHQAIPNNIQVGTVTGLAYSVIRREDVVVPAGTFTGCYLYRYHFPSSDYMQDLWIKHGVGIVKVEDREKGVVFATWKLRSYTLK